MATQVQFRRGTTAEHSGFKGANGEVTVDTSIKTLVVHDALTNGGFPILRQDGSNSQLERGSTTNCALKFAGDFNTGIISPAVRTFAFVLVCASVTQLDFVSTLKVFAILS